MARYKHTLTVRYKPQTPCTKSLNPRLTLPSHLRVEEIFALEDGTLEKEGQEYQYVTLKFVIASVSTHENVPS